MMEGINSWLQMVQDAQCNADAQGIRDVVHQMALAFTHSVEYTNMGVDSSGYVVDLYDAIVRRGAECAGYTDWASELEGGVRMREEVLEIFVNSTEFQGRVDQVIGAGCGC
jgi:hypothetical protein